LSTNRAIAAVTATLRNMLFQALSGDATLSGTAVTTKAPDQARQGGVTGNQINLFLYRTSIDAAWRNQDVPPARPGELAQPPLPLVLSYLMTAYGEDDDEVLAHQLLGVGMQVLNDQPVLSASAITQAMSGTGLEAQPDRVRITPHPVPMDEISRLWTTFSTGYRISVSYDASVVLIDNSQPVTAPLPVLARSAGDLGPFAAARVAPFLQAALVPGGLPGARPGDTITLTGRGLAGVTQVQVSGSALGGPRLLTATAIADQAVTVELPADSPPPADSPLPAGIVAVSARLTAADGSTLASNSVPLALVPVLTNTTPLSATLAGGTATVQVTCSPPVLATQTVQLVLNGQLVAGPPAAGTESRSSLSFALPGFTAGSYVVRLRVDGQDSIPVVPGSTSYDPNQNLALS
jgi:Pvc16 N-terminal domain